MNRSRLKRLFALSCLTVLAACGKQDGQTPLPPAVLPDLPKATEKTAADSTPTRAFSLPVWSEIRNLRPHTAPYPGTNRVLLRSFIGVHEDGAGIEYVLLLDPKTLNTEIRPHQGALPPKVQDRDFEAFIQGSSYAELRSRALDNAQAKHNAGVLRLEGRTGMVLSVDLCPSAKSLDADLFDWVADSLAIGQQRPLPVLLCVSGLWIKYHFKDLQRILDYERQGKLQPIWANHSYKHLHKDTVERDGNFLCLPGTDVMQEILETERALLLNGLLPSVFFRFPGLVSNAGLLRLVVLEAGLIPLGTDAWVANGKLPIAGSIALLHGNGNERHGIRRLQEWYRAGKLPASIESPLYN